MGSQASGCAQTLGSARECAIVFTVSAVIAAALVWLYLPFSVLQMGSDQNNIASFAAAIEHPERYAKDLLLGEPKNFQWYTPVYVQYVRFLARVAGGYADAFGWMIFPTVVLFASGTYFFLRELSGSRWVASVLAAVFLLSRIEMPFDGGWCVTDVSYMLPRTAFLACLPWVLLLTVRLADRPGRWWVVGACISGLFYVHPASAPPWGVALFVGLACSGWGRTRLGDRVKGLVLMGVVSAMVVAPYVLRYAGAEKNRDAVGIDKAKILVFAKERFPEGYYDVSLAIERGWKSMWSRANRGGAAVLCVWAVIGLLLAWREAELRRRTLLWVTGGVAFVCVVIGVPWVDLMRAETRGDLPFQVGMIRGLKFWPWWLLIVGACGWPAWRSILSRPIARCAVTGAVLVMAIGICWPWMTTNVKAMLASTRFSKKFAARNQDVQGVLSYIEHRTLPDTLIDGPIWLRHTPGRPITFCWKDSGCFLYANYAALKEQIERQRIYTEVSRWKRPAGWMGRYQLIERAKCPGYAMASNVVVDTPRWKLLDATPGAEMDGAMVAFLAALGDRITPYTLWQVRELLVRSERDERMAEEFSKQVSQLRREGMCRTWRATQTRNSLLAKISRTAGTSDRAWRRMLRKSVESGLAERRSAMSGDLTMRPTIEVVPEPSSGASVASLVDGAPVAADSKPWKDVGVAWLGRKVVRIDLSFPEVAIVDSLVLKGVPNVEKYRPKSVRVWIRTNDLLPWMLMRELPWPTDAATLTIPEMLCPAKDVRVEVTAGSGGVILTEIDAMAIVDKTTATTSAATTTTTTSAPCTTVPADAD